jgi:hypothetical protein
MHDLRHTCASLLIGLGAHPKVIQEWLSHRSITFTIDVYGHLFPALSQALAERLDEVFRRAADTPPSPASPVVSAVAIHPQTRPPATGTRAQG